MTRFTEDDAAAAGARGAARKIELAAELACAIEVNSRAMLDGLRLQFRREPTQVEQFTAESICSLHWHAARARKFGRSKDEVRYLMQAAKLTSNSVFRLPQDISPHRTLDAEPGHFRVMPGSADIESK